MPAPAPRPMGSPQVLQLRLSPVPQLREGVVTLRGKSWAGGAGQRADAGGRTGPVGVREGQAGCPVRGAGGPEDRTCPDRVASGTPARRPGASPLPHPGLPRLPGSAFCLWSPRLAGHRGVADQGFEGLRCHAVTSSGPAPGPEQPGLLQLLSPLNWPDRTCSRQSPRACRVLSSEGTVPLVRELAWAKQAGGAALP